MTDISFHEGDPHPLPSRFVRLTIEVGPFGITGAMQINNVPTVTSVKATTISEAKQKAADLAARMGITDVIVHVMG